MYVVLIIVIIIEFVMTSIDEEPAYYIYSSYSSILSDKDTEIYY